MSSHSHTGPPHQRQKAVHNPWDRGRPASHDIPAVVEHLVGFILQQKFVQMLASLLNSRQRLASFPLNANIISMLDETQVETGVIHQLYFTGQLTGRITAMIQHKTEMACRTVATCEDTPRLGKCSETWSVARREARESVLRSAAQHSNATFAQWNRLCLTLQASSLIGQPVLNGVYPLAPAWCWLGCFQAASSRFRLELLSLNATQSCLSASQKAAVQRYAGQHLYSIGHAANIARDTYLMHCTIAPLSHSLVREIGQLIKALQRLPKGECSVGVRQANEATDAGRNPPEGIRVFRKCRLKKRKGHGPDEIDGAGEH